MSTKIFTDGQFLSLLTKLPVAYGVISEGFVPISVQ